MTKSFVRTLKESGINKIEVKNLRVVEEFCDEKTS